MELSDPLELNIKIAAHLIEADTVLLKDLATLVQQIDDVVELAARDVEAARFGNSRDEAMGTTLDWHLEGRVGPTILMLSWLQWQATGAGDV